MQVMISKCWRSNVSDPLSLLNKLAKYCSHSVSSTLSFNGTGTSRFSNFGVDLFWLCGWFSKWYHNHPYCQHSVNTPFVVVLNQFFLILQDSFKVLLSLLQVCLDCQVLTYKYLFALSLSSLTFSCNKVINLLCNGDSLSSHSSITLVVAFNQIGKHCMQVLLRALKATLKHESIWVQSCYISRQGFPLHI